MKKNVRVLVPGSFDPVTVGHLSVIRRSAEEYGEVFVMIFINPDKKYMFTLPQRLALLEAACARFENVHVGSDSGMVADFAREHGISFIIKGYRNEADLKYEKEMADFNRKRFEGCETLLLKADDGLEDISSSALRKAIAEGDVYDDMLPEECLPIMRGILAKREEHGK